MAADANLTARDAAWLNETGACGLAVYETWPQLAEDLATPLRTASMLVYCAVVAVLIVCLGLFLVRRDLFPICLKSPELVVTQVFGVISLATIVFWRDFVGRRHFSCTAYLICRSLFVSACCSPQVLILLQIYNRVRLGEAMKNFKITEEDVDLDTLLRRVRQAGRLSQFKVLLVSLSLALAVVVYSVVTKPFFLEGCSGCGRDRVVEIAQLFFALCHIVPSLVLLRRLRTVEDPIGLRKECASLLKWVGAFSFLWAALGFADVGSLEMTGTITWTWIIFIPSFRMTLYNCIIPVVKTYRNPRIAYKYRRNRVKVAAKNRTNAVKPSQVSTHDEERFGLQQVLATREGLEAFQRHLAQEYNVENILFYRAAVEWRDMYHDAPSVESREAVALNIFNSFIPDAAKMQINIDCSMRRKLCERFAEIQLDKTQSAKVDTFDGAILEIFQLMDRDGFRRFRATREFEDLCQLYRDNKVSIATHSLIQEDLD